MRCRTRAVLELADLIVGVRNYRHTARGEIRAVGSESAILNSRNDLEKIPITVLRGLRPLRSGVKCTVGFLDTASWTLYDPSSSPRARSSQPYSEGAQGHLSVGPRFDISIQLFQPCESRLSFCAQSLARALPDPCSWRTTIASTTKTRPIQNGHVIHVIRVGSNPQSVASFHVRDDDLRAVAVPPGRTRLEESTEPHLAARHLRVSRDSGFMISYGIQQPDTEVSAPPPLPHCGDPLSRMLALFCLSQGLHRLCW